MSETRIQKPKSDLSTRVAASVVMIAIACAAIWFGGWPFSILVTAAAVLMMIEWGDMHRVPRTWSYVGSAFLALLLLAGSEMLYPADLMDEAIGAATFTPAWNGLAAALGFALVLGLLSRSAVMAGGFLYVAIPSFALLTVNWAWFGITFWMMIVTWSTDTFAYFAGRSVGGPKLAPRISPNKTWAGLIGGMIGAAILGALTASFFELGSPFVYLGALMGLIAQAGDLYESWLKRRAGIKDSGSILPGHGGVLDRLDGLLPVVVVTFLILAAGLWTG